MDSHASDLDVRSHPPRKVPVQQVDATTRSLGPKAAALQSRRRAALLGRKDAARTLHYDGVSIASDDGAISFLLRAAGSRLFVQRTQRRPLGTATIMCMAFGDRSCFLRWCDKEPTRFDHPLLFDRLLRHGHEVFSRDH